MSDWLDRALAIVAEAPAEEPSATTDVSVNSVNSVNSFRQHPSDAIGAIVTNDICHELPVARYDRPPEAWDKAVHHLRQMDRPNHVSLDRWQEIIADATRLLKWGAMLGAMDWGMRDLFGINPQMPLDRYNPTSLVGRMRGQSIVAVTSTAVILRDTAGATSYIYRRLSADPA